MFRSSTILREFVQNLDKVTLLLKHSVKLRHFIATGYGLDGPGIESRWGEIFRTCPHRPWGPPSLLYNGYRVFPGVKSGQGVTLTPHPLLVPWS